MLVRRRFSAETLIELTQVRHRSIFTPELHVKITGLRKHYNVISSCGKDGKVLKRDVWMIYGETIKLFSPYTSKIHSQSLRQLIYHVS
jgi:hypothetical protein